MKLRSDKKKRRAETLMHKLQSHNIPPVRRRDRKKVRVIEELNVATNGFLKDSTVVDKIVTDENNGYSTRNKARINYESTESKQKQKETEAMETVEEEEEEDAETETDTDAEMEEEEELENVVKEEETELVEEVDVDSKENQLNLIIDNIIVNLRNVPLLHELDSSLLEVSETILGEGHFGTVRSGYFNGITIACKSKRNFTSRERSFLQAYRELEYAAKLSLCRYMNRYIGWVFCDKQSVFTKSKKRSGTRPRKELYVLQSYIENGDARSYLSKRERKFHPNEVLQASICLFSALTDAHTLNIGIVDLKLENFLIDSSGSGWLTDFGSCIDIKDDFVDLNKEDVHWTKSVAAPEMLREKKFFKASDVFMGTVIIAELMTADLNDAVFAKEVLHRSRNYKVKFSHTKIDKGFRKFFKLLEAGLSNDPEDRPDASTMLQSLLNMKC